MSPKPTAQPVPESSDDVRVAGPLRHVQTAPFAEPLPLELGGSLPGVDVAYETWGTLDADASNAVLVCHAISGDSHAARHDPQDDPGWWDELIGPGRAIDTDRYFVVCSNVLGGCRGTTGPGAIDPKTGEPYGAYFPAITVGDMVAAQRRLMNHLGVSQWRAVVGGSLGGHQAMTWATRHPQQVKTCVAVATSPRLTSQALAFDVVARNAIQSDPHFADGQYYGKPDQPDVGLAIARMLGHITYLSTEAMDAKFDPDRHQPREVATAFEKRFSVGSYLAHQGQKFTERFDANSYVAISLALDRFDLGDSPEALRQTFSPSTCDWLVVSFSSDWLFTPTQSRQIVDALTHLGRVVSYTEVTTRAGHDGFLLPGEIAQYGPLVSAKLDDRNDTPPPLSEHDEHLLAFIPPDASVLDLGCGSGRLLAELRRRGHDTLVGVEVAQPKLIEAVRRGLDVIDLDLNVGLPAFSDRQFDVAVLSATLQIIENVAGVIDEMTRVADCAVVSFSNFAFREFRREFAEDGRSPKASAGGGAYGHAWHDTPNRRFPSILDFREFCEQRGLSIRRAAYYDTTTGSALSEHEDPNLNADLAIFEIARTAGSN
ncbi:MAG: homoserine O-acetyltransferase [Planctomycetota bacterium]